jgi:hypothetical protein
MMPTGSCALLSTTTIARSLRCRIRQRAVATWAPRSIEVEAGSHDVSHRVRRRVGGYVLCVHVVTVAAPGSASPPGQPGFDPWPPGPGLPAGRCRSGLAHRPAQFLPGRDAELGEHRAQVPLDGARTEEQLGADLRVCQPVAGQAGDVPLLRGKFSIVANTRLRTVSPVASSSWRPRSANAAAPIRLNTSWASRSCSRASRFRCSRRSHSPYMRRDRARWTAIRVRASRSMPSR